MKPRSAKDGEDASRVAAGQYELLVQSITDYAIYMLDPEGYVTSWNAGAARFKGYQADEIIGQHFSRFYLDEDREAGVPTRALATALDEGRFEAEGWRRRKDGSRFWASVVIDPIRSDAGELIGFAKITRDLSERRQAQEALEQAQQAFLQSQKMEAIGKLTGGVAHDFNNLLAAIIGSIDLARRRMAEGKDIGKFLDNVMQAAQRGTDLTQRMLAFARKQELQFEAVDVAGLVRGMADLLDRTIGPGVNINTRFPLVLEAVRADPSQLELAVMNLAVNARDAMPDGGDILIAARRATAPADSGLAPGNYICLSVADEGEGMDAETLARAVDPFFTTKGVGKGTGLGLSMVAGMAEQVGGTLTLESQVGKGTTVTLWLPIHAEKPPTTQAPAVTPEAPPSLEPITILAVDDDDIILVNTTAMLSDLGHTVLQATSGAQALQVLARQRVDLLVTDFAMPGMTGGALAEAVQAGWPDLPILIISGFAELPAGAALRFPRLSKPFGQNELARALLEVAQRSPSGDSGEVVAFRPRA